MPYRDGPYLVRGPITLCDQNGDEIEADRRVVALCRCGKSRLRPFCDGSHHLVRFRAPSGREFRGVERLAEVGTATGDTGAVSGELRPETPRDALTPVDRDLALLRRRLLALSAEELSPLTRSAVADAARLLAEAAARLRQGLPDAISEQPG